MAPQRPPSSPTSLLWAHQLKREHGFLLDRMKKLEAEIVGVETRSKAAAGTAGAEDIAAIAKKVQSLADSGGHAAMEKIREEVMERFEDVGAEIEAVTIQVSNLERSNESLLDERRRAVEGERALLKRIEELEGSLKEYERSVRKLGKKFDEQKIGKIRENLEQLSEDVKGDKLELEMVQASILKLDEVSEALKVGNANLAQEVKELAERPVHVPAPVVVAATRQGAAESGTVPHEPDEEGEYSPDTPSPAKKPKATKKKITQVAPKAVLKSAMKQPAVKTQPQAVRGVATVKKAASSPQQPLIDERLKKPIVRRGRGWIEIEDDAEEDEDESMASVVTEPATRRGRAPKLDIPQVQKAPAMSTTHPLKRGPGRPRKDAPKDALATPVAPPLKRGPGRPRKDAPKVAPAPRRTIVQPDEIPPPVKKSHKKRPIPLDDSHACEASKARGQPGTKTEAEKFADFKNDSPEPPSKKQRRGLTNIFTSPLSSSISPAVETIESLPELSLPGRIFESDTSQPTPTIEKDTIQVQPPKRRTIVQLDDETVLRNYREGLA